MGQGGLIRTESLGIWKKRAEETLKLKVLEGPSLAFDHLGGVFDENGGRAQGRLPVGTRREGEAEESPVAHWDSRVVLKLEDDIPEVAIVADGGKVLAVRERGRARRLVR